MQRRQKSQWLWNSCWMACLRSCRYGLDKRNENCRRGYYSGWRLCSHTTINNSIKTLKERPLQETTEAQEKPKMLDTRKCIWHIAAKCSTAQHTGYLVQGWENKRAQPRRLWDSRTRMVQDIPVEMIVDTRHS